LQTLRLPILLFFLCGLSIPAVGQQDSDWTWKDRNGVERTRAELDKILAEYEKYITSNSREGKLADLLGAELRGADLSLAKLQGVNLLGADLQRANLRSAKLQGALLSDANLQRANLRSAKLQGAILFAADLREAKLAAADLQGAILNFAELQGAVMNDVRGLPDITGLAFAKGLSTIVFRPEDIPTFVTWKKALQEAGYTRASKELVAAIRRNNQPELWETILFDWTCEFGANPLRPLTVLLWLWLAGTTAYAVGLAKRSGSGLYLLATGEKIPAGNRRNRVRRMRWEIPRRGAGGKFRFRFAMYARRALGTAALFSMMSAFNIGFREVNLGRWIRLMQPREFDIKARGWLRVVSGLQSLTSVYLLALAILSHFGTPFDF
jgi:hypothetical protein